MKKRVGFQFNALEDTVESIGLEMVEQLALNPHQVGTDADAAGGTDAVHTKLPATRHHSIDQCRASAKSTVRTAFICFHSVWNSCSESSPSCGAVLTLL
jgi:hypothetical protein